jgi:hypothetical protein
MKARFISKAKKPVVVLLVTCFLISISVNAYPWHDETHLAIARAAGYRKWYNATGADMAKLKAGRIEELNHFVSNPRETIVTSETVLQKVQKYNMQTDITGHLYGAIIASVRDYLKKKQEGKYGEYHLAFCSHYVGDLSQPLHNTLYNSYNRKHHSTTDGIINHEVLDKISKIKIYRIKIESEEDLANEIARIANISIKKGYQVQDETRLLTAEEAYDQISHSASLFQAILKYVGKTDMQ